ncbi:MAG: TraR/DksA family transcriptional regulator [Candidatus Firestonebacteria bacterium]|jgi:DnaK suppressor protein|nr:TraR/DksA family transcriptional regulator [Candidatus Firestonebacteria bacterium]
MKKKSKTITKLKKKKVVKAKPIKLASAEIKKFKALLLAQKIELIEELNKNLNDSKKIDFNEVKDSVDLASDTYDTEFLHNLSATEKKQVEDIDEALNRIASGTFGVCENCSKKINNNRLVALPQAKLCIACQQNVGG